MHWFIAALPLVAAYLIGAIPFGYLVARWRGVDIFAHGSKNIGATNVGRVLGARFGALVFALDFAKGALPVALAVLLRPSFPGEILWAGGYIEVAAGVLAFLGHLFPIYLRFHGGKGVATGAGAVAVLVPLPMLAGLCAWLLITGATRYVSLGSIGAVIALCITHLCYPEAWSWRNPRTWFLLCGSALVILKHHANIRRLLGGTESQIQETNLMLQLSKSTHVLALGLWFGAAVFLTFVAAPSLFQRFEVLAQRGETESWFERPDMFQAAKGDAINAPKEQGTRAAGYAVGPMFRWYFTLQGLCGLFALVPALSWLKLPDSPRAQRWRVNLIIVALACVLAGWPIEQHVTQLRIPRNQKTEAYLLDRSSEEKRVEMFAARADFANWHLVSLALNFATIFLVTGALALAANLPTDRPREPETPTEKVS